MSQAAKSEDATPGASEASSSAIAYFEDRRAAVGPFVRRHFSLRGALRLHRESIGWDLLRAPANVALSPVYIASRLIAIALRRVGLRKWGDWLAARRILLPTRAARRVERLIYQELLLMPVAAAKKRADAGGEGGLPRLRQVDEYGATRSAVNEVTVVLVVLGVGYAAFQSITPGVLSLTPSIAASLSTRAAIEAFPLGAGAGALWYSFFPAETPLWLTAAVGAGLATVTSISTTFAGIVADPLQLRLGIHRRRLLRLIDTLEDDYFRPGARNFLAREQYLARLSDFSDLGISLVRLFRS